MSSISFHQATALEFLKGETPAIPQLEELMGTKCPPFTGSGLVFSMWMHQALGRYAYVMASRFEMGYREQAAAVWKEAE